MEQALGRLMSPELLFWQISSRFVPRISKQCCHQTCRHVKKMRWCRLQWVPVYSPSLQQQWHNGFFAMFVDNLHTQLLFDEEELTSPPDTKELGTNFLKPFGILIDSDACMTLTPRF